MADVNTILATGYIRSLDKIIGVSFVKQGGTASQLLAADGSVKTESSMAVGSAASVSTATMAASSTAYLLGTTSATTGTKITPQFDTQAYISTDSSGNATIVAYKFSGAFSGNASTATTATKVNISNVAQTLSYLLMGTASTSTSAYVYANTGVTYNPNTKVLVAPTFSGSFSGNATSATVATSLSTSTTGSTTLPVYFSGGKPVATSTTLGVCITGKAATAGTADNATKAYGKVESELSVSYAATAGSATSATSAGYAGKVTLAASSGTTLYIAMATTTAATSTALYSDTGMVYNASTNNLRASEFSVTSSSTIRYNTTEKCLEFVVI